MHEISKRAFFALILLFLPWAAYQPFMRIPGDALWLFTGAKHILAGHTMSEFYLDNNPPMSFLIFTPAAAFAGLGMNFAVALNSYAYAAIAFAAFLTYKMLWGWEGISSGHKAVILISWLVTITVCSQSEFAQKDHFIAITLLPFLLAQYAITENQSSTSIRSMAILLGLAFILVKPHYGLLALANVAYRFYRQRRLSIVFDFDFVCLSLGAIAYAIALWIYFPDFLDTLLRLSFLYYVIYPVIPVTACLAAGTLMCACIAIFTWSGPNTVSERNFKLFLCSMAALAILVFWIQNKGFSTQLFPAFSILLPAMMSQFNLVSQKPRTAFITALCVIAGAYALFGFRIKTHGDLKNSSLAALVQEYAADSSFFVESGTTSYTYPVSYYTGIPVASRFPSLWFTSGLYDARQKQGTKEDKRIFGDMIAEDLARHKPKLVMTYAELVPFYEFFGDNPNIQREWKNYKSTGKQYILNPEEFATFDTVLKAPPIVYEIYIRK